MTGSGTHLAELLNEKIKLLVGISFGIFLFILFFDPFAIERFDFNDKLLFISGFGAITFIISLMASIIFPWLFPGKYFNGERSSSAYYLKSIIILILCSVAYTFYLRYVGDVSILFYTVFKIVLICLIPPLVLKLSENFDDLTRQNASLILERKLIQGRIEKFEEDNLNKTIEFISDNRTENLSLQISEVILIQAADNYVEIVYAEGENIRKKLVRNTLRNIELQIKKYSNFIRCHRTFIVNMHYIEKLNHDFSNHWLTMKGYTEKIPVSRQYLLKLKEAL